MYTVQQQEEWLAKREALKLPLTERDRRYMKVRGLMQKHGIDCLVVCAMGCSPFHEGNVRYFTGEFTKNNSHDDYVVFPQQGDPVLVLTYALYSHWAKKSWVTNVKAPDDPRGKDPRFLDDGRRVLAAFCDFVLSGRGRPDHA